jgi:hypothetical protein
VPDEPHGFSGSGSGNSSDELRRRVGRADRPGVDPGDPRRLLVLIAGRWSLLAGHCLLIADR